MSTDPIRALRDALSTTPRERAHVAVAAARLDDEQRTVALALVEEALAAGDWRAPALLTQLLGRSEARARLEELVRGGAPQVAVEAAWELDRLRREALIEALVPPVERRQLGRRGIRRTAQLLLRSGAELELLRVARSAADADAAAVILDEVWSWRRLHLFPSVWWRELGLLRRRLDVPAASFREPALAELERVVRTDPTAAGFAPIVDETLPPTLAALTRDITTGRGSVRDDLLDALPADLIPAATVYAADAAMNKKKARGVAYLARLAPNAHRDVLDWAATQRDPAMVEMAASARPPEPPA